MSSQLASTLQQALKPYLHYWKLPYANSTFTGVFRKIIQLGDGRPGERSFNTGFLPELAGKGLDPTKAAFCFGRSLKLNHDTGGAYLRTPYGKLKKLFGSNALPLKVVIGLVALSDVEYTKGGHKLLQPDWHGKAIYNSRKIIDYWPSKGELRLKVNFDHKIPDGVGLIGVFGVIPF